VVSGLPVRMRAPLVAVALLAAASLFSLTSSGSSQAADAASTAAGQPPACPVPGSSVLPLYMDTSFSFEERAADLVSCMTLPEKAQQLNTTPAPAIPRLGVKQYQYQNEGQHGVLANGFTSFPVNFASTMSWDPGLVYQESTAISDEIRGLAGSQSGYGPLTYWAPTVNMDRDPRWGRTDEAFGEDPFLVGQIAGAYVDGYQGETPSGQAMTPYLKVAATAKHFALNNVESSRMSGSSDTTDANIRNYYTAQFRTLTQDAHLAGVMTSYNAINGTPSPADTYTANELLQRTYGFSGYTTSDCGAIGNVYLPTPGNHEWAPPGWTTDGTTWTNTATGQTVPASAGGQAYALRAGTDLNCTGPEATPANIQAAIDDGVLSEGVVDAALIHDFTIRMETGEFDPSSRVAYQTIGTNVIQSPANQALATKAAAEDLVLLKNENVTGTSSPLLPADPSKLNNVVIVGNLANTVTLGDYSGTPSSQVDAVQGITSAVKAANPNATVTFDSCGTSTTATAPASCSAATQAAIKAADLVIVFVGTDLNVASESHDRASLAMPGNYNSLIEQVSAIGNPNTAMVIQANGPVDISGTQGDFPAIVYSAYNGESQGTALAQVLFGQQNPAGHLDFTWFKDDSQLPSITNYGLTSSETGGLGRTYEYFTGTPTYPFGYGLSYTNFTYSHVKITPQAPIADHQVDVRFDVTNSGSMAGTTVAQVYAAAQFSVPGVELPNKQLVGFQKTQVLQPGQTESISIPVEINKLEQWDTSQQKMVVYDGAYQFRLATDASDVVASNTVTVHGSLTPKVQTVTVQPGQTEFTPGQTLDLNGKNPWIADDTGQASDHVPADNIVEAVNNDQSFVNLANADVTYASSNPNVATVSNSGVVQMVAHGTTTISVTVDGVTGSTPIVVQQPFSFSLPARVAHPGDTLMATAALPNNGPQPLSNVNFTLTAPSGWTVTPTGPTTFASVPSGQTATTTWDITVPSEATPSVNEVDFAGTYRDANGQSSLPEDSAQVSIPFGSLADARDTVGITDDSAPNGGNLDGGGRSYSQQSLAAAGLSPGATVKAGGVTYTMPNLPAGQPDAVATTGQAIAFTGSGLTLGFLGMAANGEKSDTGSIIYTDGTTQTYTLTFPDWFTNNVNGVSGDQLVGSATINGQGFQGHIVGFYAAEVPLEPGKTIADVVLPTDSNMHIFAMGLGEPLASLSDAFNDTGISDDSNHSNANLDGGGHSFSQQSLDAAGLSPAGTVTEQGITFTMPNVPAGQPDNTSAGGQVISLTGSGTMLGFMGMAVGPPDVVSGTGSIVYTDGTTQTYTLTFPDWFTDGVGGAPADQLAGSATLNSINGDFQGHAVGMYTAEVPLEAGKTAAFVTLPSNGALHIFAMSTG
jgi:beta-glucosidase